MEQFSDVLLATHGLCIRMLFGDVDAHLHSLVALPYKTGLNVGPLADMELKN